MSISLRIATRGLGGLVLGTLVVGASALPAAAREAGRSPQHGSRRAGLSSEAPDRAVLRGRATLDGKKFDADFVGAVVLSHGMTAACQAKLPPVADGRYRVPVMPYGEVLGCGRKGSHIVLWTFVDDRQLYSTNSLRWPGSGRAARFAPAFSTSEPRGAAPTTVGLSGEVFRRGQFAHVPLGTRVEAYIGSARCALTSVRQAASFSGYIMGVAGPEAIPGCTTGATVTFRINGRPAVETTTNTPHTGDAFDLTIR